MTTALGTQADPDVDAIDVDGTPIATRTADVYLAMHKPAGFITTSHDPQGRKTIFSLLPPELPPHVVAIGRLDLDTEGLLLLTTDGELAHRIAHPRYAIDKEYFALVRGDPSPQALERLRTGVAIEGQRTAPALAEIARAPQGRTVPPDHTWVRIVIHEGRKRQVRLMCAAVGHPVRSLLRTRIGDVLLARLATGKTRPLADQELASLRQAVGLDDS